MSYETMSGFFYTVCFFGVILPAFLIWFELAIRDDERKVNKL